MWSRMLPITMISSLVPPPLQDLPDPPAECAPAPCLLSTECPPVLPHDGAQREALGGDEAFWCFVQSGASKGWMMKGYGGWNVIEWGVVQWESIQCGWRCSHSGGKCMVGREGLLFVLVWGAACQQAGRQKRVVCHLKGRINVHCVIDWW